MAPVRLCCFAILLESFKPYLPFQRNCHRENYLGAVCIGKAKCIYLRDLHNTLTVFTVGSKISCRTLTFISVISSYLTRCSVVTRLTIARIHYMKEKKRKEKNIVFVAFRYSHELLAVDSFPSASK